MIGVAKALLVTAGLAGGGLAAVTQLPATPAVVAPAVTSTYEATVANPNGGEPIATRAAAAAMIGAGSQANTCGVTWHDLYAIRSVESPGSIGFEQPNGTARWEDGSEIVSYADAHGGYQFIPSTALNISREPLVIVSVRAAVGREPGDPTVDRDNIVISAIWAVALLCDNGYGPAIVDQWFAIKSYNGTGPDADRYADTVTKIRATLPQLDAASVIRKAAFDFNAAGVNLQQTNGAPAASPTSTSTPVANLGPVGNFANNIAQAGVDGVHWAADKARGTDSDFLKEAVGGFAGEVDRLVAPPSPPAVAPTATTLPAPAVNQQVTAGFDPNFNAALNQMIAASGNRISVYSGYRSPADQLDLWNQALAKYGSIEVARSWVAPSDGVNCSSDHCRGIAADLAYADTDTLQWAHENAGRFGLEFRLANEDWHVSLIHGPAATA